MFIVCVGVGFFGGLNTFAFMAAEVSIFIVFRYNHFSRRSVIHNRTDTHFCVPINLNMRLVMRLRAIREYDYILIALLRMELLYGHDDCLHIYERVKIIGNQSSAHNLIVWFNVTIETFDTRKNYSSILSGSIQWRCETEACMIHEHTVNKMKIYTIFGTTESLTKTISRPV